MKKEKECESVYKRETDQYRKNKTKSRKETRVQRGLLERKTKKGGMEKEREREKGGMEKEKERERWNGEREREKKVEGRKR